MAHQNYETFLHLFDEWKDIVDKSTADFSIRQDAKLKIDRVVAEINKPKTERDLYKVDLLIEDLENVKSISKYVKESAAVIKEVCYNK